MKKTQIQLRNICRVIWVESTRKQEDFLKELQQENFKLLLGEHFKSFFTMEEAFKVTQAEKSYFHVIVCSKDKVEDFINTLSRYELDNVYQKCIVLSHIPAEIRELKECQAFKNTYELVEQIYYIQKLLLEIDKNANKNKFQSPELGLIPLKLKIKVSPSATQVLLWIKEPKFPFKIISDTQIQCVTEEIASSLIMQPSQKNFIIIVTEMTEQCKKWLSDCQNLLIILLYDHNKDFSLYDIDIYDPQSFQVVTDIQALQEKIQMVLNG